jgi:predicted DNA-binding transcriptional regulator YafY
MHRSDLDALGDTLEKLRCAVRERRQVRMQYQSQGQTAISRRDFDPYAIVHSWGWWYVIGFCHLRGSVRTFRLDRIQELIMLEKAFDIPAEFDIHAYLEKEQAIRPGIPVRLHFTTQASAMAREYDMGWEAVEQQPDGSLVVTKRAPDLNWAARTVLAYGPLVQVFDPPELRRLVREWAHTVEQYYSEPESPS